MARFFWFTVEFGLIKDDGQLKVYGSGLLSSSGELEHCIESPVVQRYPAQLEWIVNQYFEIHHYQPLLFYVDSFAHLFGMVDQLEQWLSQGKLDNVAPGEPLVNPQDLESFLQAKVEDIALMTDHTAVCVITGGSSGIGLATARHFAERGYCVAFCGRQPQRVETATAEIATAAGSAARVLGMVTDVRSLSGCQDLVRAAHQRFGRIES